MLPSRGVLRPFTGWEGLLDGGVQGCDAGGMPLGRWFGVIGGRCVRLWGRGVAFVAWLGGLLLLYRLEWENATYRVEDV